MLFDYSSGTPRQSFSPCVTTYRYFFPNFVSVRVGRPPSLTVLVLCHGLVEEVFHVLLLFLQLIVSLLSVAQEGAIDIPIEIVDNETLLQHFLEPVIQISLWFRNVVAFVQVFNSVDLGFYLSE